ncbi:hypothetical protein [Pasteuria penetrans]|nr:hypothetical protein [Pasteuria penetrans]
MPIQNPQSGVAFFVPSSTVFYTGFDSMLPGPTCDRLFIADCVSS